MINNFELIKSLMKFEDEQDFYFLQLIQRKKEHPDLGRNNRCVKTFYIYSLEQFDDYEEEIKQLCQLYNARAYIHLNRRNAKDLALDVLEGIVNVLKTGQHQSLNHIYDSACGRYISKDKTWVVDIDVPIILNQVKDVINKLQPNGDKIVATVPTKNGFHLITTPFNRNLFEGFKFLVDVHTNNPTILYIP